MFKQLLWRNTLVLLTVFSLALAGAQHDDYLATTQGRETVFEALVSIFKENYWDASYLDWDLWADVYRDAALSASTRRDFDGVARRMIRALEDDHSLYVGLVHYVDEEELVTAAPPRPGLGIQHEHLPGSGIVLQRVFPQSPAENAGLRRGDVIVAINEQDVRRAGPVTGLLAAAVRENEVRLSVQRRLERLELTITPQPVRLEALSSLPQAAMIDERTGYLYIPTFNGSHVANEVHRLIGDLQAQGAQGLVLDLRGNLGGRLSELGLVLGAFVEGPWAQAVSRGNIAWRSSYSLEGGSGYYLLDAPDGSSISRLRLDAPARFNGPLAVLVDSRNSSAGEVGPLVLQNLSRATVIGERTFGNVEAIRGFDLPDGSLVMVAVANLEGIDGSVFYNGVEPDVYAVATTQDLARGYDAPVAEALRALRALPFTPGRFF